MLKYSELKYFIPIKKTKHLLKQTLLKLQKQTHPN